MAKHRKRKDSQKSALSKDETSSFDDMRAERIALARKRIVSGFYNSKAIRNLLAERLLSDPEFVKTL
jgi:hypothetical protein